jgi:streptogramin lyase
MAAISGSTHHILALAGSAILLPLIGCGVGTQATLISDPTAAVTGTVHGGIAPIVGATVSLMAAGTTGYGSAPTLLSTTLTGSGGSFTLPGHVCPTPDSLVYVQATGGNPGSYVANTAINLIAIIGNCSAAASAHVTINEATTVAAAFALAQFASITSTSTGIGTSSTNITGLNNAAGPASLLVNSTTGVPNVTSASAGVVLPTAVLDTLANILAACTNSTGPLSNGPCTSLFSATAVNSVKPIDTLQAAFNIALNPGTNVPVLFGLASATGPFQPTIAAATPPNDFTLAVGFNGGGIAPRGVNAVAIDASGNAWVTDYYTNSAGTISGLIEITPTGTYPGGSTGFANTYLGPMNNLAIDQSGYIWVTVNSGTPTITALTSSGSVYTAIANANSPNGIAIDKSGDVWYSAAGNNQDNFYEIVNAGNGNYTAGPTVTAVDHFGVDVCITPNYVYNISIGNNSEPSSFTQYSLANGTTIGAAPDNGNGGLSGCAVDNAGNLWLADFGDGSIEVVTPSITLAQTIPVNSAVYPQELALDGLGNVFVATYVPQGTASYNSATANPASLVEFTSAGKLLSPAVGYLPSTGQSLTGNTGLVGLTSQVIAPGGVAIDASGNVWLSGNDGQSIPSTGNVNTGNLPAYVTEIVGIAAPVVTPKSAALTHNTITTRP